MLAFVYHTLPVLRDTLSVFYILQTRKPTCKPLVEEKSTMSNVKEKHIVCTSNIHETCSQCLSIFTDEFESFPLHLKMDQCFKIIQNNSLYAI